MNAAKIAHPAEIKSVMRNNGVTLSIEEYLCPVEEAPEKGYIQSPLKFFSKKSVYKVILYSGKNSVYANIPVSCLRTIRERTKVCTRFLIEQESGEGVNDNSIAYQTIIRVGNFKNRTPAQILMSNPNNRKSIISTANWLKDNKDKSEGNMLQHDAIMEAVKLFDEGKLQNKIQQMYKVFDAPIRTNTRKTRKDGKNFVSSMKINCCPQKNYPYQIEITNYYAFTKGVEVVPDTISDKTSFTIYLEENEWDDIVEQMEVTKKIFLNKYGIYELERAESVIKNIFKK